MEATDPGQPIINSNHSGSSSTPSFALNNPPNTGLNPVLITSVTAPAIRSWKAVDSTVNLIRYCRRKDIYVDIGLCVMKQQCHTVRFNEDAIIAQNFLAAVGAAGGFVPQQREHVARKSVNQLK